MVAISHDQENSSLDRDVWSNILEDEYEKDDYFKEEALDVDSKRLVKSIFRKSFLTSLFLCFFIYNCNGWFG